MLNIYISAVDENFIKLSASPAFKAPCYKKKDFLIHAFEVVNGAHTLDDNLQFQDLPGQLPLDLPSLTLRSVNPLSLCLP